MGTTVNPGYIGQFIQACLRCREMDEVTANEAAVWLDAVGILRDSKSRPGLPLRNLLRSGGISNAEQRPKKKGGHWFILRSDPANEIFEAVGDSDLPKIWGMSMEEMRDRGIIHSGNAPISDIAEYAMLDHLPGAILAPTNTKGFDLKLGRKRIQVKAARIAGKRRSNLSPLRSQDFDQVAVVLFDAHLAITEVLMISKKNVLGCSRWSSHVNGYLPSISKIRNCDATKSVEIRPKWQNY